MLCYCPYSGTNWRTDNFRGKWKGVVEAPHPIFNAPIDSLLQRAGDLVVPDQVSKQEQRLLFLALLNSTGLIRWSRSASPQPSTIMLNAEKLLSFINWYDGAWKARLRLPEMSINSSTYQLREVSHWIEAWQDCRVEYEEKKLARLSMEEHWAHQLKQEKKEAAIQKLIRSSLKRTEEYAGRLASWAMEAAEVPEHLREDWSKIFKLEGMDIFACDDLDLLHCLEWMEEKLPMMNSPLICATILEHLRKIKALYDRGLDNWLSGGSTASWRLVDDEDDPDSIIEANKTSAIVTYAPATEPRPENYQTRLAYLKAKSAWELKKSQQLREAATVEQIEENLDKAELAIIADNLDLLEDAVDLDQLDLPLSKEDKRDE